MDEGYVSDNEIDNSFSDIKENIEITNIEQSESIDSCSNIVYCDFIRRLNAFSVKCEEISSKSFENYNFCLNHYIFVLEHNGYIVENNYIITGIDEFVNEDIFNMDVDIFNSISTYEYESISNAEIVYMNELIDEFDSDSKSDKSHVSVNSFYNNKYCDIITPDNMVEHYYNRLKIREYISYMIDSYYIFDFDNILKDHKNNYEEEIILLNNINLYTGSIHYYNEYEYFNIKKIIKENMRISMDLCDELYCFNFKEIDEDCCIQCIEAQQTTEEEIFKHNINRFYKNNQNKYKLYLNRKINYKKKKKKKSKI